MSKTKQSISTDDKTLVILTHILGLFLGFLAPLVILLVSENEIVKKHSKASLNWQISLIIYGIGAVILSFILIGLLILPVLAIAALVLPIIATVKASEDPEKIWVYPLSLPLFQIEEDNIETTHEVVDVEAEDKKE